LAAWEDKLSMPLLVYLHADRLIPRASVLTGGTHIPCTDLHVQTEVLAVVLFASACWNLRRKGLIDLDVVHDAKAKSALAHADLRVVLLNRSERPGLEGTIAANVEDGATIRETILRWSGSRSTNPWHDAIGETIQEARGEGLLVEAEITGGVVSRLLRRESELQPVCEKITALEGRFDVFASSWREFQTHERPLHDLLYAQCKNSLMACAECWVP
jgi:hypothetical protein